MMDRQAQIELILDHFEHPRRRGALAGADAWAEGVNPGCGDVVKLYLRVDARTGLVEVAFEGRGCTISQAAASYLSQLASEKTIEAIRSISQADLTDALGAEVVRQRTRCVTLSLDVLREAIENLNHAGAHDAQT